MNHHSVFETASRLAKYRSLPLGLDRIACVAGWSKFHLHLHRRFREVTGESPKQYQQRLRLEAAAVRLLNSEDSIMCIAMETGYDSHEVFSRAFMRLYRVSPSLYRKRRQTNESLNQVQHAQTVHQVGPCIGLYRTTTQRERKPVMSTSAITRQEIEARPILFIQRRIKHTEFQATFAECFPRLYGHCIENGYQMAGNPIARYLDFTPGLVTVDCCIPLQQSAQGADDIRSGELAAGSVAFATHRGPYDTLNETYAQIEAWMSEQRLEQGGPNWEWYVTDPGEVPDPAEWQTEVYFPIK